MAETPLLVDVLEGKTPLYTTDLRDENNAVVGSAVLSAARLTLYSEHSSVIINSRSTQNVLNANDVTITVGGLLTWKIREADVRIVDEGPASVRHRAVFVFEWNDAQGTARQLTRELQLVIQRVPNAPF